MLEMVKGTGTDTEIKLEEEQEINMVTFILVFNFINKAAH